MTLASAGLPAGNDQIPEYEEEAAFLQNPEAGVELGTSHHRKDESHGSPGFILPILTPARAWARKRLCAPDWTQLAKTFFLFLLPSFVQSRLSPREGSERKLHPTSHLDGIRGLAALLVVFHHILHPFYFVMVVYGGGEPGQNTSLFQLPILNLLYSGHPWVCVFFVVSGYSLSIKPIKQMRSRQWAELNSTLTSATFRRFFRLYLPCYASTCISLWLMNLNFYESTRRFGESKGWMRFGAEEHIVKLDTWWAQWADWCANNFKMIWVWTFELYMGTNYYDGHTWTIPVEFRCSLVLFLSQSAVARKTTLVRILALVTIGAFAHQWGRWDVCIFLAGPILVEYDLIASDRLGWHSQSKQSPPGQILRFWVHHLCWISVLALSLFLLAFPEIWGDSTPGYRTLTKFIPPQTDDLKRYWPMWGSILFLAAINNVKFLASFFNTRPLQYLGKISFSLYLIHGPLYHTFGYWLEMTMFERVFGLSPQDIHTMPFHLGFFICFAIIMVCCIWAADFFMRIVDEPSVKFASWLQQAGSVRS